MKKIIYLIIILLIIFICENVYAYDYKVGDKVRYRETIFYIINVDNNANTLTLLKAEPLTVEEVETYSSGIGVSISNQSGYGGMKYHSTSSEYASSYIKKVVDAWAIIMEQYLNGKEAMILLNGYIVRTIGIGS